MAYFTADLTIPEKMFPGYKVTVRPAAKITVFYDITLRTVENITVHIGNGVAAKLDWDWFNNWIEEAAWKALENTRPIPFQEHEEDLENGFNDELLNDLHSNAIANYKPE